MSVGPIPPGRGPQPPIQPPQPPPPEVFVQPDSTALDLLQPDSLLDTPAGSVPKVVWPLPRSAKIDVATVLINGLVALGLDDDKVKVIANGSFHPNLMRDEDFNQRCVIAITRANDAASREALGELTGLFTVTDLESGAVIDTNEVLKNLDLGTLVMKEQASEEIVDIMIFDENAQRIEQLYLLIKILMFAGEKTFMEQLGYLEVIRTSGSDSAMFVDTGQGGTFVLFSRNMQYRMKHLDFVAGVEQVVRLIQEQFTVNLPDGTPTTATATADL